MSRGGRGRTGAAGWRGSSARPRTPTTTLPTPRPGHRVGRSPRQPQALPDTGSNVPLSLHQACGQSRDGGWVHTQKGQACPCSSLQVPGWWPGVLACKGQWVTTASGSALVTLPVLAQARQWKRGAEGSGGGALPQPGSRTHPPKLSLLFPSSLTSTRQLAEELGARVPGRECVSPHPRPFTCPGPGKPSLAPSLIG